jgi:Arf-GAP with SH3 domain, ANK repeat and PH domain-containing protein
VDPPSPEDTLVENGLGSIQPSAQTAPPINVDISCQRSYDDTAIVEDGPLFRATMKSLEQKTGNMRTKMKKVLKRAEAAQQAQLECNEAVSAFMDALREAATSNANAVKPALEHYFDKIAREILYYEKQNTINMQKLIIDPLTRLYTIDIKQAESKKRDFEEESRDYYAYVGRYLGQRQDSLKEKKRAESDSKYQSKRRNFELKRFDYSSFMQDLHGGRKEQEVLSQLTKFAYAQAKTYLSTSVKVQEMMPQLEALNHEVKEADKEYQFQRTEREEKRRALETSNKTYVEPETVQAPLIPPGTSGNNGSYISDAELSRADSTSSTIRGATANATIATLPSEHGSLAVPASKSQLSGSPGSQSSPGVPMSSPQNKFKGIRDLEEKDYSSLAASEKSAGEQRKEGLLWALSRPGSHLDPKGLNKQAWHK